MAHYVAELIQQADQASGPDSGVAMERARVAIMDLWSHRWQIQRIDPLADQRQALNVLSSLFTEIDPWRHNPGVEQRMMSRAFQALRVMVVGAALLLQEEPTREIEAAEVPFLDNNETETLKMLAAWRSLFELDVAPASRMRFVVFGGFDSADGTSENQGAPEPEEAGSEKGNSLTPAQQSRLTILRSLERSSAILAEVIEHHQRIIKDGVEVIPHPTDKI
jgi:hypothetical protein